MLLLVVALWRSLQGRRGGWRWEVLTSNDAGECTRSVVEGKVYAVVDRVHDEGNDGKTHGRLHKCAAPWSQGGIGRRREILAQPKGRQLASPVDEQRWHQQGRQRLPQQRVRDVVHNVEPSLGNRSVLSLRAHGRVVCVAQPISCLRTCGE